MPALLLILLFAAFPVHADDAGSQLPPTVIEKYSGGFKDDYLQELARVHTFLSIAEQNISTQLGLIQYGQGFYHPVNIRFDDGAPAVSENPFFYVQPMSDPRQFSQDLVVNVEAFARRRKESSWKDPTLREGFNYAMTQLILNDIAGGEQAKTLPIWVQEGLAVYISGSGDALVAEMAGKIRSSQVNDLVGEFNRPYPYLSKAQWARYYLVIKYIYDAGGVNAFQEFVRELISGQSAADAILHTLSQEWLAFKKNVQDYSAKAFLPMALSDNDPRVQSGEAFSDSEAPAESR